MAVAKRLGLSAICVIVFATPTWADDFGARKYPFVPKLIENKNPALCNSYLSAVSDGFYSTKPELSITEIKGATWLDWKAVQLETAEDRRTLSRLDIDLDGSGKLRTVALVHTVNTFGSGDVHSWDAYLFDSPATFQKWQSTTLQSEVAFPGVRQYFPGDSMASKRPVYEIYFVGDHKWFSFRGKPYFLTSPVLDADYAGVAELTKDGRRQLVCVARTNPPQDIVEHFTSLPGLKSYLKVLWTIGHASGGPCGSLHAEDVHDMQAEASIRRAAIRPWATSNRYVYEAYGGAVYYEYDQRMLEYVKTWGYLDVWNYREYQTYLNHFQPAHTALAAYYRTAFDVPEQVVGQRAQKIFEEITGAHFLLPHRYESGSLKYHFDFNDLEYAELQIRMLEGESPNSLLASLTGNERLPVANAVEHPSLLNTLIERGVDVNTPNRWDKTPLMVAAHLNRPDSVKLLLQAGADLNATTRPMNDCGLTIEHGDRTALMYAAENADIDVIRLLVDAGAKVDVKDSLGDGVGYYLSRNPYLTTAQRGMTVPQLLASTREAQTTAPSFDCTRAKQWVEKMICNDSALARQDRELAGAFKAWMRKSSSPDRTKVEQVAWLGRRTEQCQSVKEETRAMSCLQQQTRARIRYFHNRIAE